MTEDNSEIKLTEIPASDILEKIKKGEPVEYDHVTIIGDLDLNKLDLPKENEMHFLNSPIKVINSKIVGNVNFRNTIFRQQPDFSSTDFRWHANFRGAVFGKYPFTGPIFEKTTFSGNVTFGGATFGGSAHFEKAIFRGYAFFKGATFNEVALFKGAIFEKATFTKDASFIGLDSWEAYFDGATFENVTFISSANFENTTFIGLANFKNVAFKSEANFENATFSQIARLTRERYTGPYVRGCPMFIGNATFKNATFNFYANFEKARFNQDADFEKVKFSHAVSFENASFNQDAIFRDTIFSGNVHFGDAISVGNTHFERTIFNQEAHFEKTKFIGKVLTFRNAKFDDPESQESAFRIAKNVLERTGDREEAGYHFYQEMDAKRKRKSGFFRYPEFLFIQLIFGYGVHPFRLVFCWFLTAIIFALFYAANHGIISKLPSDSLPQPLSYFIECFYFSIVTAVTPGYGKYELTSGLYQVIASIQAIFGTFMWAAFIATFARKYMR